MKGGIFMSKIVIESSDKNDTPVQIEEKLQKAVESLQLQRENKQFTDVFLKAQKERADVIVSKVFDSMIEEIAGVLGEGE